MITRSNLNVIKVLKLPFSCTCSFRLQAGFVTRSNGEFSDGGHLSDTETRLLCDCVCVCVCERERERERARVRSVRVCVCVCKLGFVRVMVRERETQREREKLVFCAQSTSAVISGERERRDGGSVKGLKN